MSEQARDMLGSAQDDDASIEEMARKIVEADRARSQQRVAKVAAKLAKEDPDALGLRPLPWVITGGVYVIEVAPGAVKIGVAENIHRRCKTAQTYCPHKIRLLAWFEGDRFTERHLHQTFHFLRIHGEIFQLEGGLLDMVLARNLELTAAFQSLRGQPQHRGNRS